MVSSSSLAELLRDVEHRPYSLPTRGHAMTQSWEHLLFAHWAVHPEPLSALIPEGLELDTFNGSAWLGVVPFFMRDVRFSAAPLFKTDFCELNVRTYVRHRGRRGVYFFSLDASNPFAVEGARILFDLPYFHSQMQIVVAEDSVAYKCFRRDSRGASALFDADYRPTGPVIESKPGSIEEFLTERYCFFTRDRFQTVVMGNIHHRRWPLQIAAATIRANTMWEGLGLRIDSQQPLLHYSRSIDTVEWFVEPCNYAT